MIKRIEQQILDGVKYVPSKYENRLSASEASSELCELYLKRKHIGITKNISQATIGSLLHLGLEIILQEEYETELYMDRKIEGTKSHATATMDFVCHKNKVVIDWKTTKEYALKMLKADIRKGNLLSSTYIMQMNHQNYVLGYGYKMYLGMFLKDAKVDMKTGIEGKSFEIIEVPLIPKDIYLKYIKDKCLDLESFVDTNTNPPKCKDLWPRKIGGVTVPAKCRFYCSVAEFCPHYTDNIDEDTKVSW